MSSSLPALMSQNIRQAQVLIRKLKALDCQEVTRGFSRKRLAEWPCWSTLENGWAPAVTLSHTLLRMDVGKSTIGTVTNVAWMVYSKYALAWIRERIYRI